MRRSKAGSSCSKAGHNVHQWVSSESRRQRECTSCSRRGQHPAQVVYAWCHPSHFHHASSFSPILPHFTHTPPAPSSLPTYLGLRALPVLLLPMGVLSSALWHSRSMWCFQAPCAIPVKQLAFWQQQHCTAQDCNHSILFSSNQPKLRLAWQCKSSFQCKSTCFLYIIIQNIIIKKM